MTRIVLDFETYSPEDLIKTSSYKYMQHPEADIVCLAYKVDDEPTEVWLPGSPVPEELKNPQATLYAHDAGFDFLAWNILGEQYGLPPMPLRQWVDTKAMCLRCSLPGSLAKVGEVLDLEVQKDKRGKALMRKISFPLDNGSRPKLGIDYTNQDLIDYVNYCKDDVNTTYYLVKALPADKLATREQKLWELTQRMNFRGLPVDVEAVDKILAYIASYVEDMTLRIPELTDGQVTKATQTKRIKDWVCDQGIKISNLQAGTVEKLLKQDDLPAKVQEMLTLRQTLARSSTAKYTKLQDMAYQGRVFNNLVYYGAGTGRWTGAGFQMHNLPRASVKDPEAYVTKFKTFKSIEDPVNVSKALIRAMICAKEGKAIMASDYSAIENRLLMWLAGEQEVLASIAAGRDQYIEMASYMYSRSYDSIKEGIDHGYNLASHRRRIGKIIILGCGFQMGAARFKDSAEEQNVILELSEARSAVDAFRAKHPRVKKLWRALSNRCIVAIQNPGMQYEYNNVKFRQTRDRNHRTWLVLTLPSGRSLFYFEPHLSEDKYGVVPGHMGRHPKTKQWARLKLIPGRITENVIQALARDIMANGMLNVDKHMRSDVTLLGSVHDEAIAEVTVDQATPDTLAEFNRCLCRLPEWAKGLPLNAEGYIAKRYKKG